MRESARQEPQPSPGLGLVAQTRARCLHWRRVERVAHHVLR